MIQDGSQASHLLPASGQEEGGEGTRDVTPSSVSFFQVVFSKVLRDMFTSTGLNQVTWPQQPATESGRYLLYCEQSRTG